MFRKPESEKSQPAGKSEIGARATDGSRPDLAHRKQSIVATVGQIEKQFGKGSIMRLGEDTRPQVQGITTGSISLDLALGGIGLPKGRVVEIFGPESSGKTTIALHVVANAQRAGGIAAFIDAEHALDPVYAKKLGVDVENLLVSQPDTGEQALEICEMLVRSNALDVAVVDSVAALVPKAEIDGEMGEPHVGLQARLMSQALRKLTAVIARTNTCVIFINQLREKIGVMFGNPETTPGGRALKFYASVRLDIRRVGSIKEGEELVGSRVRVTVAKNKIAPPFRKAEFDLLFSEGISHEGDLLDFGTDKGVIDRQGTWLSFGETRLGQGRDKAKDFLRANPDVSKQIESAIRKQFGLVGDATKAASGLGGSAVAEAKGGGAGGSTLPSSSPRDSSAAGVAGASAVAAAAAKGATVAPPVAAKAAASAPSVPKVASSVAEKSVAATGKGGASRR